MGARLALLDEEQGGAVLLICLAAILVLLLMSWLVLDGIFVTQDKIESQASADVAAFSQASVKSRSMNMIAFTNVAKRSIVGVHAVYESMFESYSIWYSELETQCAAFPESCDEAMLLRNRDLYWTEEASDYGAYFGNRHYYLADLRALDNYQHYIYAMTPWWGWSEAVLRGQRNGATMVTSFPAPRGTPINPEESLIAPVEAAAGGSVGFNVLSRTDGLPVYPGDFWGSMVSEGMEDRGAWEWEHSMNVNHHASRSQHGAAKTEVISFGATDGFSDGLDETFDALGTFGRPFQLDYYDDESEWLFDTSNIVLTYHNEPQYFGHFRDKYDVPGGDYEIDEDSISGTVYRPEGQWGMARSEMSFQAQGSPDMWRPAWTARMRPVVFPNEFQSIGYDFNAMYSSVIDHLVLSGRMHDDLTFAEIRDADGPFFDDLVYFEMVSRAMGQSTIEGIAR